MSKEKLKFANTAKKKLTQKLKCVLIARRNRVAS